MKQPKKILKTEKKSTHLNKKRRNEIPPFYICYHLKNLLNNLFAISILRTGCMTIMSSTFSKSLPIFCSKESGDCLLSFPYVLGYKLGTLFEPIEGSGILGDA